MQTIGERLEEARKRKGISLREAAEATKIRSDFLSNIEQNKFDFDLPDIYKRGFIGNYARYLKLNADTILTDYQSQRLSSSRLGKKAGTEWFGKMEVKNADAAQEAPEEDSTPPSFGQIGSTSRNGPAEDEPDKQPDAVNDTAFYLKAGLIFVGTLALVFILFVLVKAILGGSGSEDADSAEPPAPPAASAPAQPVPEQSTAPEPAATDSLTLEATGTVYLIAKQSEDGKELYKGTLGAGESATFERSGKVEIIFTAGENLIVVTEGGRLRPSVSGQARITVD